MKLVALPYLYLNNNNNNNNNSTIFEVTMMWQEPIQGCLTIFKHALAVDVSAG